MDILLDQITLPEHGEVELKLDRKFAINVSAEQVRHQVNRWLLLEVSSMIGAEAPTLVINERVVWRVPAVFTAPHVGQVGVVGSVEVDVQTGEMNNTTECKAQIERCAQELAARMPLYPARREVAVQYAFQINITADEARRKVNFWLLTELSYMLIAAAPKLVIGEQVVWRVPALLTASHVGPVGIAGEIDVDVQTGVMQITPECKATIEQAALQLTEKLPLYKPRTVTCSLC